LTKRQQVKYLKDKENLFIRKEREKKILTLNAARLKRLENKAAVTPAKG
jgi:hypothetical protein